MYRPKSFQPANSPSQGSTNTGYVPKSFQKEKKTIGGFINNIGESGVNLVKDLGNVITHPIQTAKSLGNIGLGVAQKLIPGRQEQEQYADAVGQFYKQRYGGIKNIANTLYNDPVGVALDASAVLGGTGAGARGVAGLSSKGATAVKLSSPTAKIGKLGTQLTRAGEAIDPIRAAGSVVRGTAKQVGKVGSKLDALDADKVLTRGIGNPAKQKKMIVPMEEIIPKYNLYSRTPEAAQEAIDLVSKQRSGAIAESGVFGKLQELIAPLDDEIRAIKSNPNLFRGDIPLSPEAAKRLAQLIENRNSIVKRFAKTTDTFTDLNPEVSVADIDTYRRVNVDPNIPQGSFARQMSQRPAKDKAFQQTRKALSSAVDEAAGTQEYGRDMQSLIKAKDVFEGYQTRAGNRQALNFSKLGGAGLGGIVKGVPGAVGGFIVEQFVNSPKGLELIYKTLKKLGGKTKSSRKAGSIAVSDEAIRTSLLNEIKKQGVVSESDALKLANRIIDEAKSQDKIVGKTQELSKNYLGKPINAQVKGFSFSGNKFNPKRIAEKAGKGEDITDISRSTVVVDDYAEALRAFAEAEKNNLLPKRDYVTSPTKLGYRGTSASIKMGEGLGEIQFNVPEILFVKMPKGSLDDIISPKLKQRFISEGLQEGVGHDLYSKLRPFDDIDRKTLPPAQRKILEDLERQSKMVYDTAWNLHKSRMKEIGPTLRRMGFNERDLPKNVKMVSDKAELFAKTGRLFSVDR